MYNIRPNLVLGFHGCDESTCNLLLNSPDQIRISREPYDWLGHGMYFWENNYERALHWAKEKQQRGRINKPSVIGAVIDLGHCCDFLNKKHVELLGFYYHNMANFYDRQSLIIPANRDVSSDSYKDKLLRELDCAVIEYMNDLIHKQVQHDLKIQGFSDSENILFDSVRNVFTEGGPAFEGSGIREKSHIQICIRNFNCIKGFFLPRKEVNFLKLLNERAKILNIKAQLS